jgi:hypothetical protein
MAELHSNVPTTAEWAYVADVKLADLVPMAELHSKLPTNLYASQDSVEWAYRVHRAQFIAGGAVFLVAGRLLAYPARFARVALEIGAAALARRHVA